MFILIRNTSLSLVATALLSAPAVAATHDTCMTPDWLTKSDEQFAADCVGMAFGDSLEDREILAWLFFARVNQLIEDNTNGGMSGSGKVPVWMAWPTDADTFHTIKPFEFSMIPRSDLEPVVEKKDLEAGRIATADPDGANEEVNRNKISYDYLISEGLTTKLDVAAFFAANKRVDMPVGSIELKASWLQLPKGTAAPDGALTFKFHSGTYWWRGLHIMVKMQSLSNPDDIFYSEEPSWFWSTFEFNDNPGVRHVRENLITQRAPLDPLGIKEILFDSGIAGFGFENYAPNGTQIRFTVDGNGTEPVILGHTDMEDFAGTPNTAQAQYWRHFEASCHTCHATASYNPVTRSFFPFSVPTGALDESYNMADKNGTVHYLGQGYLPLDFMWPIAFQAR